MTLLIYVNTSKQVGDAEHLKVFANVDAAETRLEENDPEGVAFEYEVLEWSPAAIPTASRKPRAHHFMKCPGCGEWFDMRRHGPNVHEHSRSGDRDFWTFLWRDLRANAPYHPAVYGALGTITTNRCS
jgi:hypothetical protein